MMREDYDYSNLMNTTLTPDEERRFQAWARSTNRLGNVFDYDLRGAWKENAQAAANGHLTDKWKKPNHPTFSTESVYNDAAAAHGMGGGRWLQSKGKWQFYTGPGNLRVRSPQELGQYFQKYEPDSRLIITTPMR